MSYTSNDMQGWKIKVMACRIHRKQHFFSIAVYIGRRNLPILFRGTNGKQYRWLIRLRENN